MRVAIKLVVTAGIVALSTTGAALAKMQKQFNIGSPASGIVSEVNISNQNPYLGAWQLDYVKVVFPNGRVEVIEDEGMEIKLFTNKHFSYIQHGPNREFSGTGGGPYEYDDSTLTLTHAFQAVDKLKGYVATWNVEHKGDSFVLKGFKTIVDSEGKDVTDEIISESGESEQVYRRIKHEGMNSRADNPLASAWTLTRSTAEFPDGRKTMWEDQNRQIKLFTSTHFTFINRNDEGNFGGAGGGTYRYENGSFSETHTFQYVPGFRDYTAWWNVEFEDETVIVTGPAKVINGQGEDVTEEVHGIMGRLEEVFERLD